MTNNKYRCDDCIHAQAYLDSITYVKFANTDIMIVACPKHLAMLKDTYLKMQYLTVDEIRDNYKS